MTTSIEPPSPDMGVARQQEQLEEDSMSGIQKQSAQDPSSPLAKRGKACSVLKVSSLIEPSDVDSSSRAEEMLSEESARSPSSIPSSTGSWTQKTTPPSVTQLPPLVDIIAPPLFPRKPAAMTTFDHHSIVDNSGPSAFNHPAHSGRPNIMTCVNPSCKLIREPCGCIIPLCVLRNILDPKNLTPPCSVPMSPTSSKIDGLSGIITPMSSSRPVSPVIASAAEPITSNIGQKKDVNQANDDAMFTKPASPPKAERASPPCPVDSQSTGTAADLMPPLAPRLSARRLPFPLQAGGSFPGHRRHASAAGHLPFQSTPASGVSTAAAASCAFQRIAGSNRRGRTASGPAYLDRAPSSLGASFVVPHPPCHSSPGWNARTPQLARPTRFSPPLKREDRERLANRFSTFTAEALQKVDMEETKARQFASPETTESVSDDVEKGSEVMQREGMEEVERSRTPENSSKALETSTPIPFVATPPPYATPAVVPFPMRSIGSPMHLAMPSGSHVSPHHHHHHSFLLNRVPRSRVNSCFQLGGGYNPQPSLNASLYPTHYPSHQHGAAGFSSVRSAFPGPLSMSAPSSPALPPRAPPVCTCGKLAANRLQASSPNGGLSPIADLRTQKFPRFRSMSVQQQGSHYPLLPLAPLGHHQAHQVALHPPPAAFLQHQLYLRRQQHPLSQECPVAPHESEIASPPRKRSFMEGEDRGSIPRVTFDDFDAARQKDIKVEDAVRPQRRRRTVSAAACVHGSVTSGETDGPTFSRSGVEMVRRRAEGSADDISAASMALMLMANSS
ncbi:hypothetical protein HDU67_010297 [Dinochytrium kinnereticum]|nr:hypothetical protein HDU67_010297 [Dinochytrium kinnereticum]